MSKTYSRQWKDEDGGFRKNRKRKPKKDKKRYNKGKKQSEYRKKGKKRK